MALLDNFLFIILNFNNSFGVVALFSSPHPTHSPPPPPTSPPHMSIDLVIFLYAGFLSKLTNIWPEGWCLVFSVPEMYLIYIFNPRKILRKNLAYGIQLNLSNYVDNSSGTRNLKNHPNNKSLKKHFKSYTKKCCY